MMQPSYGFAPMWPARVEVPIHAEQHIQVTTARFVVGYHTYPIAGLTHVVAFSNPAQRTSAILAAIFFGLLFLICAIARAGAPALVFFVPAAICGIVAATRKATHGVAICTAGRNIHALLSHDAGFVARVVTALNQAIASR